MIIVLGSINMDLLFKVERLPRPGETVLCPTFERDAGGKGANQAAAAAKVGGEVMFIGHVGADANGEEARSILERAGVDCRLLATGRRPTAIAVIGVDRDGENQIIVASGANLETVADQVEDGLLVPGNTVLLQNEIPLAQSQALAVRAAASGARTILNLAPAGALDDAMLKALDVLIVNELELAMVTGAKGNPADLAAGLADRHHLDCIVTLGGEGALLMGPSGKVRVPALAVEPIDTTGAGDAFAGGLAAALDGGHDMVGALRRASVTGALACTALGAQGAQPTASALKAALVDLRPNEMLN